MLHQHLLPVTSRSVALVLGMATLAACGDAADRAAKARIFSAEEPALEVVRAREKLDVSRAGNDPATWQRIWRMDAKEASQRIGSYTTVADATSTFTTAGKPPLKQVEHTTLTALTEGDFHLKVEVEPDTGLEFVWFGGRAYARSRFGPFRERRIDRAQHDAWRDQGQGPVRTFQQLFEGRLVGGLVGQSQVAGRRGLKFALSLGPAPQASADTAAEPIVYGKQRKVADDGTEQLVDGPDRDTTRRLAFEQLREALSARGELVVDEATGVVLSLDATGTFKVPPAGGDPAATVELVVKYALTPAPGAVVTAPKDVVAPRMPHVVKDPLGWHPVYGQRDAKPGETAPTPDEEDD